LRRCLEEVSGASDDDERWDAVAASSRVLLQHPETGAELARRIIAAEDIDDVPTELLLLEALLDGARIDAEGRGSKGPAVLDAIERSIDRRAGEARPGLALLGRCYVRASLKPPERLKMSVRDAAMAAGAEAALRDLDDLISSMRDDARGDPYAFHAALSEMLATYDVEIQETLVRAILDRFDPAFARLGCYWLLDPSADLRRVAADAFLGHARQGRLDAATRSRLAGLRNWMPADAARATIDGTLKAVLRQDLAGEPITGSWTLHRTVASIPDGSGGQSFAVAARQGGRRCIAMVLLKQGRGVGDAYLVPCSSATEQKQRLGFVEREMDAFEVDPGFLSTTLAAALAENIARGEPPAHGLLDVVEICGIDRLVPRAMTAHDWVGEIEPEGALAGLSKQHFGRMVNAGADWPARHRLLTSWFEDGPEIREILMNHITPRSRETALWRYLEGRRDWWAMLTMRAAAVLAARPAASPEEWQPVAAMGMALADGRPARKMPILGWVHQLTLMGPDDPWKPLAGEDAESIDSPEYRPEPPEPEKRGELRRLLGDAGMDISPAWLDGYLAAVVVAPRVSPPTAWIGGLLDRAHGFPDHARLQRFLDFVMLRYNTANTDMADADVIGRQLRSSSAEDLRQWARGFIAGTEADRSAWRDRNLRNDDRAVLKLIAAFGDGNAGLSEVTPLLPAWLSRRHALRR
jgi:yecA family protein